MCKAVDDKVRSYARLYRVGNRSVKRQTVATALLMLLCGVAVFAAEPDPAAVSSGWFTPQNVMTGLIMVFHLGMLRQKFADLEKRLAKLEEECAPKADTERRLNALEYLGGERRRPNR